MHLKKDNNVHQAFEVFDKPWKLFTQIVRICLWNYPISQQPFPHRKNKYTHLTNYWKRNFVLEIGQDLFRNSHHLNIQASQPSVSDCWLIFINTSIYLWNLIIHNFESRALLWLWIMAYLSTAGASFKKGCARRWT